MLPSHTHAAPRVTVGDSLSQVFPIEHIPDMPLIDTVYVALHPLQSPSGHAPASLLLLLDFDLLLLLDFDLLLLLDFDLLCDLLCDLD